MDRHATSSIKCFACNTVQGVSNACVICQVEFGAYHCGVCRLWTDRATFHCEQCGICRSGKQEDYVHCVTCTGCTPGRSHPTPTHARSPRLLRPPRATVRRRVESSAMPASDVVRRALAMQACRMDTSASRARPAPRCARFAWSSSSTALSLGSRRGATTRCTSTASRIRGTAGSCVQFRTLTIHVRGGSFYARKKRREKSISHVFACKLTPVPDIYGQTGRTMDTTAAPCA